MSDHPPKLLLPTIETCPHRRVVPNGEGAPAATCRLVASMLPIEKEEYSRVDATACAACCESFPPTPEQPNPVIASLVFAVASRVVREGGAPGCDPRQAAALRDRMPPWLDRVQPAASRLTPARSMESCCYLGAVSETSPQTSTAASGDGAFSCGHPNHRTTTEAGCRFCRDWTPRKPFSRFLTLEELVPPPPLRCGPPVERWAVGITTSPRRQSTLEWCLDSVVRAGWETAHLFLDGTTRIPDRYRHWPVTWRERKVGAWPAFSLALTELLLQVPRADAYLLLQDDAQLHDRHNLKEYLERVLWPGAVPGIVAAYVSGSVEEFGWHAHLGNWLGGAVAFIFRGDLARAMLSDPEICRSRWVEDGPRAAIGEILGAWAHRHGVQLWFPCPSLVQHLGNSSTIWGDAPNQGPRRAKWFTGSVDAPFAVEESFDAFPEDLFPCPDPLRAEYRRTVEGGRRRMETSSAVLCGLCRDVRHFLPRTAARMERLGTMFREYQVVLFENDSRDATREFLEDWQRANPRVHLLTQRLGVPPFPQSRSLIRAEHMANCRNRYRDWLLRRFPDYDFMIVLDTDLAGGWSYDGIAHTFGFEGWDFVGSYGLRDRPDAGPGEFPYLHYDTWAFRPSEQTPIDLQENPAHLALCRGQSLLPVRSCFGGLGVYRMECLRQCRYGGSDEEHAVLHDEMRQLGFDKLYLNPSQIVLYSPG